MRACMCVCVHLLEQLPDVEAFFFELLKNVLGDGNQLSGHCLFLKHLHDLLPLLDEAMLKYIETVVELLYDFGSSMK